MLYLQIGYAVKLLMLAEFLNSSARIEERRACFLMEGNKSANF